MAGEQQNKVEIVVEVTGGGKVRQELASVKSGLAAVNTEVQKSSQAVTSGLAPFGNSIRAQTAELKQAEAQMRSFGGGGLAGLRNMGTAARQDLHLSRSQKRQLLTQIESGLAVFRQKWARALFEILAFEIGVNEAALYQARHSGVGESKHQS